MAPNSLTWDTILSFSRSGKERALEGVCGVAEFRRLLRRERALAERHGHSFSVLAFDLRGCDANGGIKHLSRVIKSRVRDTDEVGFLADDVLAVLLPYTTPEGSMRLGEDLQCKLAASGFFTQYKIYTFPYNYPYHISTDHRSDGEPPGSSAGTTSKSDKDTPADYPASPDYSVKMVGGLEEVYVQPLPLWKRVMDLLGSALGLLLFSPVIAVAAIGIKLSSPGPVIFKQQRVGRGGKLFTLYKFRTMRINNDCNTHRAYLSGLITSDCRMKKLQDDRVTPFGKFLRKSCLDEVPQFVNVLRGDMSLIGPRPCIPYEAREYLLWHTKRLDVTPGISGLWQVNGKNNTTFREMVSYDIQYSKLCSFWLDLKILFKTLLVIKSLITTKSSN